MEGSEIIGLGVCFETKQASVEGVLSFPHADCERLSTLWFPFGYLNTEGRII